MANGSTTLTKRDTKHGTKKGTSAGSVAGKGKTKIIPTEVLKGQKPTKEEIIQKAIEIKSQIDELDGELSVYKEQISTFFPGAKTKEDIITQFGVASCSTSNNYSVPAGNITKIKEILGDSVGDYISEKVSFGLTDTGKKSLKAEDEFGKKLFPLVEIKTSKSITFKPIDG